MHLQNFLEHYSLDCSHAWLVLLSVVSRNWDICVVAELSRFLLSRESVSTDMIFDEFQTCYSQTLAFLFFPTIFEFWKENHPLKWFVFFPMFAHCVHFQQFLAISFTFENFFLETLKCLSGHVECSSDNFFAISPGLFRSQSKNKYKMIFFSVKTHSSECVCGDVECSFDHSPETFWVSSIKLGFLKETWFFFKIGWRGNFAVEWVSKYFTFWKRLIHFISDFSRKSVNFEFGKTTKFHKETVFFEKKTLSSFWEEASSTKLVGRNFACASRPSCDYPVEILEAAPWGFCTIVAISCFCTCTAIYLDLFFFREFFLTLGLCSKLLSSWNFSRRQKIALRSSNASLEGWWIELLLQSSFSFPSMVTFSVESCWNENQTISRCTFSPCCKRMWSWAPLLRYTCGRIVRDFLSVVQFLQQM